MIRKKWLALVLAVLMLLGLFGGVAVAEEDCERYGQGYWKQWLTENPDYECPYEIPVDHLLAFLNAPARGDANVILSYQFIAAALNMNVQGCIPPESVMQAFGATAYHLLEMGGESDATREDIIYWKDILELWNEG